MSYVISHFFPGGTAEQYETAMVALNGRLGTIPDGQLLHVAGPVPGGFQVIAVQESKASWDRFMSGTFSPIMGRGIPGGFSVPPTELEFAATHLYR